jgi:toxin CptA
MTSAPAIGFEYLPSRWWRGVLMAICLLAMGAIVLCALVWWLKGPLLAASVLLTWRVLYRLSTPIVAAVGWSRDSDWTLHLHDHTDVPATLLSFRVLAAFVLLRLRTQDSGIQMVVLAPDNSDADIRRRLRMRLATMQLDEALPRI